MGRGQAFTDHRETEVVKTTTRTTVKPLSSSRETGWMWQARYLPLIILTVLFAGVLAALIGISVLLAQTTAKLNTCNAARPQGVTAAPTVTVGPTGPPVEPEEKLIYRLSEANEGILPTHYDLILQIHVPVTSAADEPIPVADRFTTKGSSVAITLRTTKANVTTITLHARHDVPEGSQSGHLQKFKEGAVTVTEKPISTKSKTIPVTSVEYLKADIIVIHLGEALTATTENITVEYSLKFEFEGFIGDDNEGLYRSQYKKGSDTKYLVTSHFQAYKARRAFPCFDEPGIRSTFTTTLRYPATFLMTRTNTAEVRPAQNWVAPNGTVLWKESVFERTKPMPVYLNAFLVSSADDFKANTVESDLNTPPLPISVIGNADIIAHGAYALAQSQAIMKELAKVYQEPYDWPKLDMVGVPDYNAGATENWGLVVYRESSLMYEPGVSTADQKRGVSAIVSHELSHMIFGNLLTTEWWGDVWLNEGFASYIEYRLMEAANPNWGTKYLFTYWTTKRALESDSQPTTHALHNPAVQTPAQIDAMFDVISYEKGAAVLHMMSGVMREPVFTAALVRYIDRMKGTGSVKYEDLLAELDNVVAPAESSFDLTTHMKNWILKAGYPVLTLTRSAANPGALSFKQTKFTLPIGANDTSIAPDATVWDIPFTLINGGVLGADAVSAAAERTCWLTARSAETLPDECSTVTDALASDDSYLFANVQQNGFYRVNYDRDNWDKIISALSKIDLGADAADFTILHDPISRGQLIDDAFNLAKIGLTPSADITKPGDYSIPMHLVDGYITTETKYGPLASALDNIRYLEQMLRGPTTYPPFSAYMTRLMTPLYESASPWDNAWTDAAEPNATPNSEETYDSVMFNNLIIETACFYEVDGCLKEAVRRFSAWLNLGPDQAFAPGNSSAPLNIIQTKSLALCYGMRSGSSAQWNDMKTLLINSTITNSNKLALLRGMACSDDDSRIEELLELSADGITIRAQDVGSAFSYIARFPKGHALAWNYLQKNWKTLARRSSIIADIGGSLKSNWQLAQLRELYEVALDGKEPRDVPEAAAFERAIARVETNILWTSKYAAQVASLVKTLRQPNP
ncbi:Aminopeptidase N [Hypsibius exemplaris]|uniref:glutamyl aminopeptidase n=1 Tax=Hypsibius exemplaris TaxID=2072580 RepID=A0A9X6NPH1_HYPEX|nr:Aminopeptidase N [Hypsibius exemplaris]